MVDLRLLYYFITVVEAGNVSKAALKLHLTQPTLTRQLQQLEEIYGSKLFIRGNRKITLTKSGIILKKRALEILELNSKLKQEINDVDLNISGEIVIGSGETKGSHYLPILINNFNKLYPNVTFKLFTTSSNDSKEKINDGIFDIAIALEPIDKNLFNIKQLNFKDEWVLYMKKDDPLASKKVIKPNDISNLPLGIPYRKEVKEVFTNWYGSEKILDNVVLTFDINSNLGILVESGFCYGITLDGAIENSFLNTLTYRPLSPKITSSACLIWKKSIITNNALSKLIDYIDSNINNSIKDKY
ncbi:MAG: LysR family transcriptional regulator [Erysipelotrichaceae bacterium]|nr:LysR family transcriptional regulator [Erysipelotrichaceae bacterium]